jgi:hypothetical protein
MKTTLVSILVLTLLIAFAGCKKEKPQPPIQSFPDYAKLSPGNYWIYQRFNVEPNGSETALNEYDSAYVEKDTMIRGFTYHKYVTRYVDYSYPSYLRDSLHYLVDEKGQIQFSSEDFSTVFQKHTRLDGNTKDTMYTFEMQMKNKDAVVNTPAGSFVTSDYCTTFNLYPPYDEHAKTMTQHRRYAKDIGIVDEVIATWMLSFG